jgi:hypothetical protein
VLLPLFLLPNLKTLYLGHLLVSGEEEDLPADFTRYIGTSKVANLTVDFNLIETLALNAFLNLPAALESFTCTYSCELNICENANIHEFYQALLPHCGSLKRQPSDWEKIRPRSQAHAAIPRSRRILVPIRIRLFGENCGGAQTCRLDSVLPLNIKSLTLYAYDDWTFDKLKQEIKYFLSFGKRLYPLLRKLRAECWMHDDIALRDRMDDRMMP